jgi:cyclopropane fatty-acyl-phospholipid synthase-like methyltransferase
VPDPREVVAHGYDQIADRYLEWSADYSVRRIWLDKAMALVPLPTYALDLGCGAGLPVAQWLEQSGYQVTGVDGSASQIQRAREYLPSATCRQADMSTIALPPASFDLIVSTYAITHVPRGLHADLFARIRTWLRPGGIFMASLGTGDADNWTGEWLGTEMFFSHFDAETNLQLVTEAGFEIVEHEVVTELEDGDTPVSFLWLIAGNPG